MFTPRTRTLKTAPEAWLPDAWIIEEELRRERERQERKQPFLELPLPGRETYSDPTSAGDPATPDTEVPRHRVIIIPL